VADPRTAPVTGSGQHPPRVAAVVLGGGSGTRLGADRNKVLLPLAGRPVIAWSIEAMRAIPGLERLILVLRAADLSAAAELGELADVEVIAGGASRTGSEILALHHLAPAIDAGELDVVAIHDGARPLPSRRLVREVTEVAHRLGGAVPGVDALVGRQLVEVDATGRVVDRLAGTQVLMQTPQAFAAAPLLAAYDAAERDGFEATDTAACIERYTDLTVQLVAGEERNLKVTVAADLDRAAAIISG
jgi:2-C-methyl-D-erythritol 4-phosphate cytidylyltransferase